MPSFQISIWSIRICLKSTKMARPHSRPMSKRPECYELNHTPSQHIIIMCIAINQMTLGLSDITSDQTKVLIAPIAVFTTHV